MYLVVQRLLNRVESFYALGIALAVQTEAASVAASQAEENLLAHVLAGTNVLLQLLATAAGTIIVDSTVANLTIRILAVAPVLKESQVQDVNVGIVSTPVCEVAIGWSFASVALSRRCQSPSGS